MGAKRRLKPGRKPPTADAWRFCIALGRIIAHERQQRDTTQQELADELHVHRVTLANWEGGRVCPTVSAILKIAAAMEIPDLLAQAERER